MKPWQGEFLLDRADEDHDEAAVRIILENLRAAKQGTASYEWRAIPEERQPARSGDEVPRVS